MKIMSVFVIIIILLFFLISRKNFSKYKDERKNSFLRSILRLYPKGLRRKIRQELMKTEKKRGRVLEEMVDEFIIGQLNTALLGVVAILILTGLMLLFPARESENITRNTFGKGEKTVKLRISDGSEEAIEKIKVGAREYTREEFDSAAKRCEEYLNRVILSDNETLTYINKSLTLPAKNEEGTLSIKWKSSNSSVIGTDGRVKSDEITEPETVTLKAVISDNNYEKTVIFCCTVIPEINEIKSVFDELTMLEQGSRCDSEFGIPDSVHGYSVEVVKETGIGTICKVALLGILSLAAVLYLRYSRLKEKTKKRNEELAALYFMFVSKLTLYIGAGKSIRGAIKSYIKDKGEGGGELTGELIICMNEIEAGANEEDSYLRLGKSIGLLEYIRLMSLICQNVRHGNSNLLIMMKQEEDNASRVWREKVKKRGEEASGKLLIPMFLLLLIVIGIVIYPAISGV